MSDFIIDPMWFYWVGCIGKINDGITVLADVAFAMCVAFFLLLLLCSCFADDILFKYTKQDKIQHFKYLLFSIIACAVLAALLLFIPDKETLIQMKLAELATIENAQQAITAIREATDYILDGLGYSK